MRYSIDIERVEFVMVALQPHPRDDWRKKGKEKRGYQYSQYE